MCESWWLVIHDRTKGSRKTYNFPPRKKKKWLIIPKLNYIIYIVYSVPEVKLWLTLERPLATSSIQHKVSKILSNDGPPWDTWKSLKITLLMSLSLWSVLPWLDWNQVLRHGSGNWDTKTSHVSGEKMENYDLWRAAMGCPISSPRKTGSFLTVRNQGSWREAKLCKSGGLKIRSAPSLPTYPYVHVKQIITTHVGNAVPHTFKTCNLVSHWNIHISHVFMILGSKTRISVGHVGFRDDTPPFWKITNRQLLFSCWQVDKSSQTGAKMCCVS